MRALRTAPPDEPTYRPRGLTALPRRRTSSIGMGLRVVASLVVVLLGVIAVGPILERSGELGVDYPMYKGGPGRTGEAVGGGPAAPDILWTVESEPGIDSSPVVAGNTLVIVDGRDDLLALDLRTGAVRWAVDGDVFVGSPAIAGSMVVTQTEDGTLAAFDLDDGQPVWRADLEIRLNSSPLVMDGMVVAASDDGVIHAVEAVSGNLAWSVPLGAGQDRAVAGADGRVYAGSAGALVALDISTGTRLWTHESDAASFATPAVRDGTVYASGGFGSSSVVFAIDAATGAERWQFEPPDGIGVRTASVDAASVYVASTDRIYALDRARGTTRWARDLARQTRAAIGIDGDTLFVVSQTRLHALDASSGADRWDLIVGGLVDSGTTVVDGLVVAGTSAGRILAIGAMPD